MNGNFAALGVAVLANAFLNVGQSVQKLGSDKFHAELTGGLPLWGLGILMTTISSFVTMWAVSLGEVSLVGAMAGTGLPFMVIFSILVLNEPIGPVRQYIGVAVIIVSAIFIGLFKSPGPEGVMYPARVWWLLGIVTVAFIAIILFTWLRNRRVSGFWLSALAGSLRGFVPMIQKLAVSPLGHGAAPEWRWIGHLPVWLASGVRALANPYTITWIVIVSISMGIFQFAHRLDTAIRNIPSFMAAFVLLPVLGGIICFAEGVSIVLLAGVGGILVGNTMVNRYAVSPIEEGSE